MLGDSPETLDFVVIVDVESLNAAVVHNVPQFEHSCGVRCDEAV